MASKRPDPPPETASDARSEKPPLVHVLTAGEGWVLRVGRRVESTFGTREEAEEAAIGMARARSGKVFLHLSTGEIRELSTAAEDELLFLLWRELRERGQRELSC